MLSRLTLIWVFISLFWVQSFAAQSGVMDIGPNVPQPIPSVEGQSGDCLSNDGFVLIWSTCGGGGGGTVTSVDMTVPAFLAVSGNPVTTSGTLAITLSGTALPTANGGTGTTTTFTQGSWIFAGPSGVFAQDNANFFVDDTNNRVGIGTTSPATAMHIVGTGTMMTMEATGGGTAQWTIVSGANSWTNRVESTGIYAIRDGASGNRLIIDLSGNVGINQSTPTSRLHVVSSGAKTASMAGSRISVVDTSSTDSIDKVGLNIQSTGTWNGASATNTGLVVNATGGTTNYAATFAGGNVGILLTDPTMPLSVTTTGVTINSSEQVGLRSQRAAIVSADLVGGVSFRSNDTSLTAPGTVVALVDAVAEATHNSSVLDTGLVFQTTTGTTMAERVRITGAGRISVNGASTSFGHLAILATGTTNNDGFILINPAQTFSARWYIDSGGAQRIDNGATAGGTISINGAGTGVVGVGNTNPTAKLHVTQSATPSGANSAFKVTGGVNTAQTLSTEVADVDFVLARTVQWATGALTTQRAVRITSPTYSFVGASAMTDAATLGIVGGPVEGTNNTLTNSHALLISTASVSASTNSYGLTVNALSGAGSNYAAQFLGGNVGVGLSAPANRLHVDAGTATASNIQFTANATTGQASTDGVIHGIDTSGNAVFNQQENLDMIFSTNNTTKLTIKSNGHLVTSGTAPTITANCGTSPSVAGTDVAGRITVGTGGIATSCTLTFSAAFATAPSCTVGDETTSLLLTGVATTTTLIISAATPFGASDKLVYNCLGY